MGGNFGHPTFQSLVELVSNSDIYEYILDTGRFLGQGEISAPKVDSWYLSIRRSNSHHAFEAAAAKSPGGRFSRFVYRESQLKSERSSSSDALR